MRLLFTGNIDNIAYSCAKFARWMGYDADVLISSVEEGIAHPSWEDGEEATALMRTFERREGLGLLRTLRDLRAIYREYDVVISMGLMSISTYLLYRPYVAVALGADMKELVFEKTPMGWLMDRAFHGANSLFFNDVDQLPAVESRGYRDARYFPVPIDVEKYQPRPMARREDKLFLVHGASLSWSLDWTENKELHRRTLKRNDIFFEGLRLFSAQNDIQIEVVVPLWGPDSDKVEPLCRKLGIENNVRLVPKLKKGELQDLYYRADIVIDQFNMPRLGYNCFEPMACGKPVLGYFSEQLQNQFYDELPPMASAETPEEVAGWLEKLRSPGCREEMGIKARIWIEKNHHWKTVIQLLLDECQRVQRG